MSQPFSLLLADAICTIIEYTGVEATSHGILRRLEQCMHALDLAAHRQLRIARNIELHRDDCGRVDWSWDCTQSLDRCAIRALVVIVIAEAGCIGRQYVSLQGDIYCVVACGCTTCYKCRAWVRVSRVGVDRRPLYTPNYVLRGHVANA